MSQTTNMRVTKVDGTIPGVGCEVTLESNAAIRTVVYRTGSPYPKLDQMVDVTVSERW